MLLEFALDDVQVESRNNRNLFLPCCLNVSHLSVQVYQELYTYDDHANTSIRHFWYKNGQMEDAFYAPTPSYAHDANSTFFVRNLWEIH